MIRIYPDNNLTLQCSPAHTDNPDRSFTFRSSEITKSVRCYLQENNASGVPFSAPNAGQRVGAIFFPAPVVNTSRYLKLIIMITVPWNRGLYCVCLRTQLQYNVGKRVCVSFGPTRVVQLGVSADFRKGRVRRPPPRQLFKQLRVDFYWSKRIADEFEVANYYIDQDSPTYGPRATSGPLTFLNCPAK